jgi:hypothetical protein
MANGPRIERDLELTDASVPTCPLSVGVPWPVDQRLLHLVDLVDADKLGPTSKLELAAALIQTAEADGLWLWDKVLRYRRATVGDAAFWIPGDEDPITFDARKPGRRRVGTP